MDDRPNEPPAIGLFKYAVVDAVDRDLVVLFWCQLLGGTVQFQEGGFTGIEHARGTLLIQRVREKASHSGPVHIDIEVNDISIASAAVLELGGTLGDAFGEAGQPWCVAFDPEGTPFCLVGP